MRWCCATTRARCTSGSTGRARSASSRPCGSATATAPTVEKRLDETDRAREAYVRHFYRADARDAGHYHLTIDSTAIPFEAVVELIVLAAASRTR